MNAMVTTPLRKARPLCGVVLASLLAACGGGGASPSAPAANAAAVTDQLTITVPRSSSSSARAPRYVSPASQSAEVDVVYGSTTTVGATVDLTPANAACTTTAAGLQCTIGVLVQPSATSFVVKLYDQLGEQGNLLSTATVAVPPSPNGTPINVPISLAGVAKQIALTVPAGAFSAGVAATHSLVVTAMDADGNPIPGTLAHPITLTNNNAAIALSATTLNASGSVTLTYNGAGDPSVQVVATDPDGATFNLQLGPGGATPTPVGPLTVSPTSLSFSFVGQVQNVTVSDPGYTGAYTVSGCTGVATYGTVTNGTLSVTASGAGSCTITVRDTASHQATVAVGVSVLSVPIQ